MRNPVYNGRVFKKITKHCSYSIDTIDLHVYVFGSATSTIFSSKSVRSSLQTANVHTKEEGKDENNSHFCVK